MAVFSSTRWLLMPLLLPLVFAGMAASAPQPSAPAPVVLYPDHLDGAYTGGFGEQTCHSCHFDHEVNNDQGYAALEGLGETYASGETYELTVYVTSAHLRNGGFQLTARHPDSTQAGTFSWDTDRVMRTPEIADEVTYVQHAAEGTEPTSDQTVAWTFQWTAPETGAPVVFHLAANAGNADDSAFGDYIYVEELTVKPDE